MVAVINETAAKKYFGRANPIGRSFRTRIGDRLSDSVEIVGVAKDAKYNELRKEVPPTIYTAWSQTEKLFPFTNIEVRANGGAPTTLIPALKSAITAVDRTASIEFTTLAAQVHNSVAREELLASLAGFFGGLALLLASIGLYGTISCNVARRQAEIGIRMALGAERNSILRMVMREVAAVIGTGLAVGLVVALATARLLTAFLYGVRPDDPLTLCVTAGMLAAAAGAAAYFPARRASRLDPMIALREE